MGQLVYRANLDAPSFPCLSEVLGKTVIGKGAVTIQGYYGCASFTASVDTSFIFTTFDVRLVTAL